MLEYLRDPLWQFAGFVCATVALFASFWIYQLQRPRKGVTYEVLSRTNLLTVREELEGKLQVLYEGEPAKSLSLIVLKLRNSGNQPILSADFERPISFCTGKESSLLTAAVTQVEPPEIEADFQINGNTLIVKPSLLNSGDEITFKLLVRDAGTVIYPDARIVGVKSVRKAVEGNRVFPVLVTTGVILFSVGTYFLFSNIPRAENRPPLPPVAIAGMAAAALGYLIIIYALFKGKHFVRLTRLILENLPSSPAKHER